MKYTIKKMGGYKNICKKLQIWENISKTLGEPVPYCNSKWKNLRDRYCKILKEKKNKPSGKSYKTKNEWEFFESLSFLSDHVQPRKTIGNFSELTSTSSSSVTDITDNANTFHTVDEGSFIEEDYSELYESPAETHKSLKRKNLEVQKEVGGKIVTALSALENYLNKKDKTSGSVGNSFSERMNVLLNGLRPQSRENAERKIIEYLCECQIQEIRFGDISDIII